MVCYFDFLEDVIYYIISLNQNIQLQIIEKYDREKNYILMFKLNDFDDLSK